MNRYEFMRELEILLSDLSPQERADALNYYNDYFDDAGPDNESNVIKELKSPREVSDKIKDGLNDASKNQGDFTENGFHDSRFTNQDFMTNTNATQNNANTTTYPKKKWKGWQIALMIIVIICALPIIAPIAIGICSLILGAFLTILSVFVTITIGSIALLISGVVVFCVGIATLFHIPFAGIFTMGVGLIIFALGILFGLLTIWIYAKALPACIRGFVALCKLPFKNRRAVA